MLREQTNQNCYSEVRQNLTEYYASYHLTCEENKQMMEKMLFFFCAAGLLVHGYHSIPIPMVFSWCSNDCAIWPMLSVHIQ